MKECFKVMVSLLVMLSCGQSWSVQAADKNAEAESDELVMVSKPKIIFDGENDGAIFEVECKKAGEYYFAMWMLCAGLADGSFSSYEVYVNNVYQGEAKAESDNWQRVEIEGRPKVFLNEGGNTIVLMSAKSGVPMVGNMSLTVKRNDMKPVIKRYKKYLDKCKKGKVDKRKKVKRIFLKEESGAQYGEFFICDFDLKYSFYTVELFEKDQDIEIRSISNDEHLIDIELYGLRGTVQIPIGKSDAGIVDATELNGTIAPPGGPVHDVKIDYLLCEDADSRQMEGLIWCAPSEKSLTDTSKQEAIAKVKIPYTGYYLIRLRSKVNGKMITCDISAGNKFNYKSVPAYLSYVDMKDPNNFKNCFAYTRADSDKDDPMIFLHGGAADKVVAYNDDVSSADKQSLGLTNLDALTPINLDFPMTGVSLSNYGHYNPESTCIAYIGWLTKGASTKTDDDFEKTESPRESDIVNITDDAHFIDVSATVSDIVIESDEEILSVDVLHVSGVGRKSVAGGLNKIVIPRSEMQIRPHSVHLICVRTRNSAVVKKVML